MDVENASVLALVGKRDVAATILSSAHQVEHDAVHEDRITATVPTLLGGLSFGQWVPQPVIGATATTTATGPNDCHPRGDSTTLLGQSGLVHLPISDSPVDGSIAGSSGHPHILQWGSSPFAMSLPSESWCPFALENTAPCCHWSTASDLSSSH
jgi:hypothetical protein